MTEFNYSIKGFGVVSDVSIEHIFNDEMSKNEFIINFISGTVTSVIASIEINIINMNLKINFGRNVPKFNHDCKSCIFLGIKNDHDLYYCYKGNGNIGTVIARFGENENYISGMPLALSKQNEELHLAFQFALNLGYCDYKGNNLYIKEINK